MEPGRHIGLKAAGQSRKVKHIRTSWPGISTDPILADFPSNILHLGGCKEEETDRCTEMEANGRHHGEILRQVCSNESTHRSPAEARTQPERPIGHGAQGERQVVSMRLRCIVSRSPVI